VDACVLWSLAVELAVCGARPDAPFDWAEGIAAGLTHLEPGRRSLWSERLEAAIGVDPAEFHQVNGWVVGAFQAAVAAITTAGDDRTPDHLRRALEAAARSGGDTDTVAAIAGALLGARWGASAVPAVWLEHLHGRVTYDRPVITADDLTALATLALDLNPVRRED
jgi:ADP-ribosylglycohydrolase